MDEHTHIGTVVSVSPGKRRVRIEMSTSFVANALSLSVLILEQKDKSVLKCRVASSSPVTDGIVVTLVAGVPRDTIAQLKRNKVVVAAHEVNRDSQRYDVKELVGLAVHNADTTEAGIVASGFNTRANAMIQVNTTDGKTIILPIVPEVVDRVDWQEACVILKPDVPLDGALDGDEDDTAFA